MPGRAGGTRLPLLAVGLLVAAAGSAPAAAGYVRGSAGLGDRFFPRAGNGGYDVGHYGLNLRYKPGQRRLIAVARIRATATESLRRFDLDLRGLHITSLRVNGKAARFRRRGQELIVRPRPRLSDGADFVVGVRYRGRPQRVIDPDRSTEGWVATRDGAFVVGEPQGSPSWFPCNDYPTDKATYRFRVTVPRGRTAVANGTLARRFVHRGRTTFVWREDAPMATYLATVTSGRFHVTRANANGVSSYVAVDPSEAPATALDAIPEILALFDSAFGDYPFETTGAIVDHAPSVGYALETQTRPLFDRAPDEVTLAHELSHQWFGDSVTPRRWRQIWLNEGFATWSEWYWDAHEGGPTLEDRFDDLYATPASDTGFWNPPPGDPGSAAELFDDTIYDRGAMTLEALREKLGEPTFLQILADWVSAHQYANATIRDFIDLAEDDSEIPLDSFFEVWLFEPGKPASW